MPASTDTPSRREKIGAYDFAAIESKWQRWWAERGTYRALNPGDPGFNPSRPKFYVLDMFPYPSGAGLHVGHPEGYTATDIVARYKRMRGFNVLHPMGWDAFGLPAEQYAIATGVHPAITTRKAIDTFRRQLQRFGFCYDWSREFATIDPDYYRWTQWIFLKLYNSWFDAGGIREAGREREAERIASVASGGHARPIEELVAEFESGAREPRINPDAAEHSADEKAKTFGSWSSLDRSTKRRIIDSYRLAYLAEQTVNWCPKLGTALANEEVTADGLSERGHFPVFRKPLKQWMLRITAYADRLLDGLNVVDWPDSTRTQQIEWIGRSEGAEIEFPLDFDISKGGTDLRDVPEKLTELGGTDLRDVPSDSTKALSAFHRPSNSFSVADAFAIDPLSFECRDPFPKGQPTPADLQEYRRTLPHVELDGATYFVTWRTMPGVVLSPAARVRALQAVLHWEGIRWRVYAVCIMPDHVHAIVRPYENGTLLIILNSIKRFLATEINKLQDRSGRVWQDEGLDHIIRDGEWFSRFLHYLVMNPVEAGVCSSPADYAWTLVHKDVRLKHPAMGPTETAHPGGLCHPRHIPEVCATLHSSGEHIPEVCATTKNLRVFTTRPDTIFGATYMVVAPEHPLVARVLERPTPETDVEKLRAYVEAARNRGDVERMAGAEKVKTGVFTGLYAINPAIDANNPLWPNQQRIPIWTADYVLMGYGTGAIMAVPGQDQRDWDFAKAFNLPIVRTVQPPPEFDGDAYVGDGPAVNSGFLNGLIIDDAKARIIDWLEEHGTGRRRVQYKLRDWLFSRQRYWGEPFPIVFDENGNHYAVEESHLPVTLPDMSNYHPEESDEPRPLLAKATQWTHTTAGAAGVRAAENAKDVLGLRPDARIVRETNTMPGWAGSCWYYLRYCDPRNSGQFISPKAEEYWMGKTGVDLYIGGSEHAVLHLLYARFWHKVMFDLGYVGTIEPFRKLFHQGLITSYAYQRPDKSLAPTDEVEEVEEGRFVERATGKPVAQVVAKMSKSLKNVVNPDDVIGEYGADTFRFYEMFMGPLEASKPWNTRDVGGLYKLCNRIWRLFIDTQTGDLLPAVCTDEPTRDQLRILHKTIKHVTEDIENLKFNTAIARLFDFVNALTPMERRPVAVLEPFLRVLSPFAPHLAEELHERLWIAGLALRTGAGSDEKSGDGYVSVTGAAWPTFDESLCQYDEVEIAIQVLGKLRHKMMVPAGMNEVATQELVMADSKVQQILAGKTVRKVIVVPGRLVNFVAN